MKKSAHLMNDDSGHDQPDVVFFFHLLFIVFFLFSIQYQFEKNRRRDMRVGEKHFSQSPGKRSETEKKGR